ncbi:hypothetical protein VDG09_17360 [Xanthomonas campestris pv. raphani]|uniref:hypothetical protein n=1 Tax=Xanthomonas campestris TaxID=339 RepID=UPI002B22ABAF|nr:hypothetical protein [Xanthomonas campestris]MEA9829405.1 hypothetical protein [Xanthomonas campestris pv. raphani]
MLRSLEYAALLEAISAPHSPFTPRASTRSAPADLRTAAGTAARSAIALPDAPRSAAGGGV